MAEPYRESDAVISDARNFERFAWTAKEQNGENN
jgi:hypothetical protein